MEVEVAIGAEHERVEVEGETYADLLAALDLSVNEAIVLVDGRPVPSDRSIDHERVTVLRLVHGG